MAKLRTAPKIRSNLTLSKDSRKYAVLLQKPLQANSESEVVDIVILNEAVRLGLLKKKEAA